MTTPPPPTERPRARRYVIRPASKRTPFGLSRAVEDRYLADKLARIEQDLWLPPLGAILTAACHDLPTDVDGYVELVKSAPPAAFEGARLHRIAVVPIDVHDRVRQVPLVLRAARITGLFAWQVITAALDRQLDAEGAPPYVEA